MMYLLLACYQYYPGVDNCVFKGSYEDCAEHQESLKDKYDIYRIIPDYMIGKQ